ncbi:MAG: sodium-dependent transporter [Bacteroidales bacterium]|nr:sodium-dependent transporter [Bacteroidales bacterium]
MAKEGFNSKMGAIAAAAGSAVGLGNIWRFPYVLGQNGGAAFLLIYVLFMMLIAMPVLISEFAIGRKAGLPVLGAFKTLAPGKKWYLIGFSGVLCAFVISSFYNVVSGWTMYYTYLSATGQLASLSEGEVAATFQQTSSDPVLCVIWMLVMLGLTGFVVARGVEKGIEQYSKVLMPVLLLLIVVVCIRAVSLDGASEGVAFLLSPDFSKLSPKAIFEALGQSFFSLSIGMGTMTTYGSYISKKQNLSSSAVSVAMIDFFIAFLAGLMIFPCAFAFGINPGQGPGLVFVTLPNIFNQMPMGQLVSVAFFFLLVVAALTSSISLLEVVVTFVRAQYGIRRKTSTFIACSLVAVFGVACSLSSTIFNFFDNFSANVLLPGGALFIVLFVPLVLGKKQMRDELEAHGGGFRLFEAYYFLTKYVVPFAISLIFIVNILSWMDIKIFD